MNATQLTTIAAATLALSPDRLHEVASMAGYNIAIPGGDSVPLGPYLPVLILAAFLDQKGEPYINILDSIRQYQSTPETLIENMSFHVADLISCGTPDC